MKPTIDSSVVTINVVLLAALGVAAIVEPGWLLRGFGIENPTFAEMGLVRTIAAIGIVLATLLWQTRHWLGSAESRPALRAIAIAYFVAAFIIGAQQLAVWYGRSGFALLFACVAMGMA